MKNKNIIRFVESFVLLPVLTMSSVGNIPPESIQTQNTPEIVSSIKQNIEATNLFAFNLGIEDKALEEKEKQELAIRQAKADAIDAFFESRKAPLAGLGMKMVEEAEKNDLDWRLLPGIATRESNAGKEACKRVKYSAFGWGSCKINFESYEQSIEVVARNLGGNNPKTASYYADKTTYEILRKYNPAHIVLKYPEQVIKIMNMIGPENLGETKVTNTDNSNNA